MLPLRSISTRKRWCCCWVPPLARFWAAVLGWQITKRGWQNTEHGSDGLTIAAEGGVPFDIDFRRVPDGPKRSKNRLHLDINPTDRDQASELKRLLALGAKPVDVGQGPSVGTSLPIPKATSSACAATRSTLDPDARHRTVIGTTVAAPPVHDPATPAPRPTGKSDPWSEHDTQEGSRPSDTTEPCEPPPSQTRDQILRRPQGNGGDINSMRARYHRLVRRGVPGPAGSSARCPARTRCLEW